MASAPPQVGLAFLALMASQASSGVEQDARPPTLEELLADLVSPQWPRVELAELHLASRDRAGIPGLLALMGDDTRVPLTDTGDLIYPGAKHFYGHGFIVDYDLDVLAVRAGWVLEELTFQDFGFSAGQIREDVLLRDTAVHGFETRPLNKVVPVRSPEKDRIQAAITAARNWWDANGARWSRMSALEEALRSANAQRQIRALGYLRYGDTICEGLDLDSYAARLQPVVRGLSKTAPPDVSEQAKLLLRDGFTMRP